MEESTMAESPSSSQPLKTSETNIEEENSPKKSKKTYPCKTSDCDKVFSCTYNLKRHMQKAHNIKFIAENLRIKCLHPSCTSQFVHVTKMLTHLESEHGVDIQREYLTFKTLDEFFKWKENEQTTNFVYFSKYQGMAAPKDSNYFVLYYKCQRDGSNRPHRASGQKPKTSKTRGTVKMNMVCPARMFAKVSKEDGSVAVDYIQSHSHPITAEDSRRQPMPSSLREDIENRLASGMSEDQIMTELTGGAYLPTGKQGDRSMKKGRGDRSSINYGIPVDGGIYFVNKKRLSTMKRRLKPPMATDTSGVEQDAPPPPKKKKKSADEAALENAALKGQLKELSQYLDDPVVCKTMLPDIHSLVTYLLSSCSAAKNASDVDKQQQLSENVSDGNPSVVFQSVPSEQVPTQPVENTPDLNTEPTVFFSDGTNIIKVAIKKHGKTKPVVTNPSSDVYTITNSSVGTSTTVPVALTKVDSQFEPSVSTGTCVAGVMEPQSTQTVTTPVIGVINAQSPIVEVLPSDNSAVESQPSDIGDSSTVEYDASVEPPSLSDPNSDEQQQIEMIQVIEHYEQSQQTPILYNLPTEGAFVTVCDVDGTVSVDGAGHTGSAIVNTDSQHDGQASASILLNAIMAANLCGTEQNNST